MYRWHPRPHRHRHRCLHRIPLSLKRQRVNQECHGNRPRLDRLERRILRFNHTEFALVVGDVRAAYRCPCPGLQYQNTCLHRSRLFPI